MNYINPYQLTQVEKLSSLVEHRQTFSVDQCEFNLFETREKASDFKLKFNGFTMTSMLRGKKVMKLEGMDKFDYLPGESVLAPSEMLMNIDFPEAEMNNPTQCTALVIEESFLLENIARINEQRVAIVPGYDYEWQINTNDLVLKNNPSITQVSNKLITAFTTDDPFKDFQIDLILRELVLALLRSQNLNAVRLRAKSRSNADPFCAVLKYIESNITEEININHLCKVANMSKSSFYRAFQESYGISPVQFVLEERLKYVKQLLVQDELSVKEVAFAAGFNDPNYFSRFFRKMEGVSPSQYRAQ